MTQRITLVAQGWAGLSARLSMPGLVSRKRARQPCPPRYAALSAVCLLFIPGCAPKIHSFAVSPPNICGGGLAGLTWDVTGEPTIAISAEGPRLDPASNDDDADLNAPDRIELLLIARGRGPDDQRHNEVRRFPERFQRIVEFSSRIEGSQLLASGTVDPAEWDSHFVIADVATASGRDLTAKHAGAIVELNRDGSAATDLAGSPLAGDWELATTLSTKEASDRSSLPTSLAIAVTVSCRP